MSLLDAEHDRLTRRHRLQSDNLRPVSGDTLDRVEQAARALESSRGYDELVTDEQGRVTLQRAAVTLRAVTDMARWPGGTGEQPDFGDQHDD